MLLRQKLKFLFLIIIIITVFLIVHFLQEKSLQKFYGEKALPEIAILLNENVAVSQFNLQNSKDMEAARKLGEAPILNINRYNVISFHVNHVSERACMAFNKNSKKFTEQYFKKNVNKNFIVTINKKDLINASCNNVNNVIDVIGSGFYKNKA